MKNYLLIAATCLGMQGTLLFAQQPKTFKKVPKDYFVMPAGATDQDYLQQTVIFKVKPQYRSLCEKENIKIQALQDVIAVLGQKQLYKKFPHHTPPERTHNKLGQPLADLSLIYQFMYSSNTNVEDAINMLYHSGVVEYACLSVTPKPLYTPNDPSLSLQYNLVKIKAYEAWDIEKGDTNTVIGITDTGFELTHEDLGGVKYNYADPINGVDDDQDGYIDNFKGWDMAMGDNDPTYVTHSHGVSVAGVACGTADNSKGIAGIGFNCKYLPVKIMDDLSNTLQINTYEAIVYAVDHGCSVVNCSWGGTIMPGQFGQDVINYAVINKDAVVVASVGNNGNTDVFYPASYDYVLSVGNVTSSDVKSGGSCYGYYVDLFASAINTYTTAPGNSYSTASASSYTAPQVSGAAGLLRSHYPSYTALQIAQLLKSNADVIDTLSGNSSYVGKLGSGRLNIYRALTDSTSPGIMKTAYSLTDGNDENYYSNDTLSITATFANFLEPTSNLVVTLTSTNSNVSVINGTVNLGIVNTLSTKDNASSPFKIAISSSATTNEEIPLKLTYTDGSYTAFEYIVFKVNQSYLNIVPNEISTTLTANGRIGFNGAWQKQGMSITFHDDYTLAYASSFMIGNSTTVSDGIYNDNLLFTYPNDNAYDNDFSTIDLIKEVIPSVYADHDYYTKFNDNNASTQLGVEIEQRTYAWNDPAYDKFIIVEYTVTNKNSSALNNLYAGIFTDWDIFYSSANAAYVDTAYNIGYARSTTHNLFAGIHVISGGNFISYALDLNQEGADGIGYYVDGGISNAEKFTCLSTMRDSAGYTGSAYGEDIANSVSAGPFSLNAGASTKLVFAIMAGNSLTDLRNSALAADEKYELMFAPVAVIENQVNNSCNATCDAQAEVAIAGGAQPFTYQWNDVDSQTTAVASGLCAGNYSVIVGDANGFTDTLSVVITEPDSLLASTQVTNASTLSACDGIAIVTPMGGTAPYAYLWSDSLNQTDSTATALCVGEYMVMVLDANGCTYYDTVIVDFGTSIVESMSEEGLITLYPNPTSTNVTINLSVERQGFYEVGVYNVAGEKMMDMLHSNLMQHKYVYTIEVSDWPEGIYFIQVTSEKGTQAQKLMVAR